MTDTKTVKATKFKYDLIKDPSVRYWVKDQLEALENRDPVDALNDICLLKKYCEMRLAEIQSYYP